MAKAINVTREPGPPRRRTTASMASRQRRWKSHRRPVGNSEDDYVDVTRPAKKAKSASRLEELPQIISAMKKEMFDLSEARSSRRQTLRDRIKELDEIQLLLAAKTPGPGQAGVV